MSSQMEQDKAVVLGHEEQDDAHAYQDPATKLWAIWSDYQRISSEQPTEPEAWASARHCVEDESASDSLEQPAQYDEPLRDHHFATTSAAPAVSAEEFIEYEVSLAQNGALALFAEGAKLEHCPACMNGQVLERGQGTHRIGTLEHPDNLPISEEFLAGVPDPAESGENCNHLLQFSCNEIDGSQICLMCEHLKRKLPTAQPAEGERGIEETIKDFANKVCRDIPEGWGLALHLEQGSGDFTLTDPYGRDIHHEEYTNVDCPLHERGLAALKYAIQI